MESEDQQKLKQGRPGSIHHVNWPQVSGHKVDIGGEGPNWPKQCTGPSVRALYCVFGLHTLAWWKLLANLTGKKLTFKFSTYIFVYRPLPPYVHLMSTHMMNAPRPFFTGISTHGYCECKWKVKTGGLGTRLGTRKSQELKTKSTWWHHFYCGGRSVGRG